MRLLNFNIIRLLLFLVLGVLIGRYISFDITLVFSSSLSLVVIVGVSWFLLRKKIVRHPFFAVLVYLTMTCIGYTSYIINIDRNKPNHYAHILAPNQPSDFILQITKRLKPDLYNEKYIASVLSINKQKVIGNLLINMRKDSTSNNLDVDTVIFTSAQVSPIQGPLNPYQFDYSKYLELQNIYHQLYLADSAIKTLSTEKTSIYGYADALRKTINTELKKAGFKPDTMGIINAMLLGQRQDIDKTIYNNYINAGTIHILAVSGLHVGIILIILNTLFKPLLFIRYGYVIEPILIVFLLWLFAIVAGLSPSVTRAVAMFSIISIAMHLKRPTNIYNTLAISAFLILLFKPSFLFQVGFQMSYLAVLGIVSIQPIFYKMLRSKYWIFNKMWQIFTVTLAAQIGVLPISLFYFHQFPGLFFVSNLVVIPFLGLVLGLGLLVIVLSLLNALPIILVMGYSTIIESLNAFIGWVATFEALLFRDIPFNIFQVVGCYIIVVAILQFYKTKSAKWVMLCLGSIIALQGNTLISNINSQKEALVIFNKSRHTVIGLQNGKHLSLFQNLDSTETLNDNLLKNYKVGEGITDIDLQQIEPVYKFNSELLLVIDSIGVYQNISFKPQYILLRNSPKINLNRVIDHLQPKIIIADASNYTSYINRWRSTCKNRGANFHYTKEKGAFIVNGSTP
ncbi:ComEC family competence protein [Winogradskyella sp. DF17]|uniref:ComEC family competence protein n=1 Tax=Winogradskyella pelagia TaxID=2819984 RepID=A0ABS3T0F0_9FLAO|nr:ComEC/Rec2 family competence protein [Winogradskyella sp. DF17]MBO3115734.1 ComEC family competence protein [Winogradskyella sp. DF17]